MFSCQRLVNFMFVPGTSWLFCFWISPTLLVDLVELNTKLPLDTIFSLMKVVKNHVMRAFSSVQFLGQPAVWMPLKF